MWPGDWTTGYDRNRIPGPQTPNTSGLHLLWQPEGNCTEQTAPVSATKLLGDLSSWQQLLTPPLSSRREGHRFFRAHSAKSSPSQEKKFHCWQVHKKCSSACPHPLCQGEQGRLGTGCHLLSQSHVLKRQAEIITEYSRASFCLQA